MSTGAKCDVVADLIIFSRSKGVYGGVNLDGTVVSTSDEWNAAYYGKKVLPPDILARSGRHNEGSSKLLREVAKSAGK